jgi:hypothetical protein
MIVTTLQQGSVTLSAEQFDFDKFQSALNYPISSALPAPISGFLEQELFPSLSDVVVQYQYRLSSVESKDINDHRIYLLPEAELSGPILYRFLRFSDQIITVLVSIQHEQDYDVWEDYIAYSFYNTILHQALDRLRNQIIEDLNIPENRLTQRYAPGYCGWPITDQKALLSVLRPAEIGVTLTDSYVMQPSHTISGIYGLRRHDRLREKMPCYSCTSVSCRVHYDFQKEVPIIKRIEHAAK